MRTYEIPIQYTVYNVITVEAENLQEAMDKAWEGDWDVNGEISTDSFEVQEDVISQINDDEEIQKECKAHGFYIW